MHIESLMEGDGGLGGVQATVEISCRGRGSLKSTLKGALTPIQGNLGARKVPTNAE